MSTLKAQTLVIYRYAGIVFKTSYISDTPNNC